LGCLVPLPLAAERHYAYQQQVTAAVVRAAQLAWTRVTLADLDGSWAAVAGGLLTLVTAAQVAAARDADPYLAAVLAEMGHPDDPVGQVQPAAFAGIASDGRGLASLLDSAIVSVKVAIRGINQGIQPDIGPPVTASRQALVTKALASGGSQLEMLTQTTVQDTGRAAVSAGMVARPHVKGYVRVLTPPSCTRCVILAGRVYRWSMGFQRHPRDDCRSLPLADLGDAPEFTTDPMAALRAGQVRGLSKAEEAAISDGADLNQIVNAHRSGAYQGMTTAEGVTRRGVAGKRLRGRQRLTVGAIQRLASDRDEALKLLRAHAYLI
jgi:hypothetical protein